MQMIGIILAGGASQVPELPEIATASLPVAGRYQAIDFSLSSMVNSGVGTVAVVSQFSSRHLNEHLKDETMWNFGRKRGGLYLVSPVITPERQTWYDGTVEALLDAMSVVEKSHEPYVIVASGDGIYNMDFRKALDRHIEKNAEITVVTAKRPEGRGTVYFGQVVCEDDGRISDFLEKSPDEISNEISCGIYIMRRRAFITAIEEARLAGKKDFVTEVLCEKISGGRVYSYHYEGYWNSVTAAQAYYDCNMDFLKDRVRKDVLGKNESILSRGGDNASARFTAEARVSGSLIAEGSQVSGTVEASVLFVGAKVAAGAVVRNSLILPGAVVPEGAVIENRIYNEKPGF